MTVEFAPARPHFRGAPRKRLSLPGAVRATRLPVVLLACTVVACATSACGDRAGDTRAALTTSAARELAETQPVQRPGQGQNPQPQQGAAAFALASSPSSSSAISANGAAALTALAVRSPARPPASGSAQGVDDAPLANPVIHSAD